MGNNALDSHASGKKHQQLMLWRNKPCLSSTKDSEKGIARNQDV